MKHKTRSLLEELETLSKNRDTRHIIENRANNVISSAIHLMEVIERNFGSEQASILEKKLFIAIKNRDHNKFTRSLKRTESENEDK